MTTEKMIPDSHADPLKVCQALRDKLREANKEIERLKEIVKDAWWVHSYGTSNNLTNTHQYDTKWKSFKEINKL